MPLRAGAAVRGRPGLSPALSRRGRRGRAASGPGPLHGPPVLAARPGAPGWEVRQHVFGQFDLARPLADVAPTFRQEFALRTVCRDDGDERGAVGVPGEAR